MADEEMSEGGGGGGKMKIIIIALVVLLAVGAAVYFLVLAPGDEEGAEGAKQDEQISNVAEPLPEPIFMPLGSYLANLRDGRRYLKVTIQLMASEPAAVEYLNTRLPEVKDVINTELQKLSSEDLKQPASKDELRQNLISGISQLFPTKTDWEDPEPIKKVLFEEFIVQ